LLRDDIKDNIYIPKNLTESGLIWSQRPDEVGMCGFHQG